MCTRTIEKLDESDLPAAEMIPRQYCPQCDSPLASESLKVEKITRAGQEIAHVRLVCEHCDAIYLARWVKAQGAWSFRKAELQKPGRKAAAVA